MSRVDNDIASPICYPVLAWRYAIAKPKTVHETGSTPVLLGRSGEAQLTAEQLASWIGTINYEVTTRIGAHVPRRPVRHTPGAADPRAPTLPR